MSTNSKLLERLHQGDKEAQDLLVEENMRLVWSIVKRYSNRGYDPEELAQIGALGLLKAIRNFNMEFGVQFSTYAVPMIVGEIKRFLRDDGAVKVSRALKETALKGWRAEEQLRRKYGRDPTISEIASACDMDVADLLEAFEATRPPESIDAPASKDESKGILLDQIKSENHEEHIINRVLIETMLNTLSARERQILILRYFKCKTQNEIAKLLGVSQVQISRIEKASLARLRKLSS